MAKKETIKLISVTRYIKLMKISDNMSVDISFALKVADYPSTEPPHHPNRMLTLETGSLNLYILDSSMQSLSYILP